MTDLKEQVLGKCGTIEVHDGDFEYVIERPLLTALADCAEALKRLGGESFGILHAHETTIRMDAGNTNYECYSLTVKQAAEALASLRKVLGEK